jgi:hypothetical protein
LGGEKQMTLINVDRESMLNQSIENLTSSMSGRLYTVLRNLGVEKLIDIQYISPEKIGKLNNIGRRTMTELENLKFDYGISYIDKCLSTAQREEREEWVEFDIGYDRIFFDKSRLKCVQVSKVDRGIFTLHFHREYFRQDYIEIVFDERTKNVEEVFENLKKLIKGNEDVD